MNKVLKKIKNDFKDTPDLIIKEIKISIFHKINIIYLESVSSSNKVNDYLLKNIINALSNHIIIKDIASFIAAPNTKMIKEKAYTISGYGKTILEAYSDATSKLAKTSFLSHATLLIVSTNFAKQSFLETEDFILRDAKVYDEFTILITNNDPNDILSYHTDENPIASNYLKSLIQDNEYFKSYAINTSYSEAIDEMHSQNIDAKISVVTLKDNKLIIDGMATFNNYELKDILSIEDANLYNGLKEKETIYLNEDDLCVYLNLTKVNYVFKDKEIIINIEGNIDLKDNQNNLDLKDNEAYNNVSKIIEDKINNKITNFINKLQTNQCDILGIRKKYYNSYRISNNNEWVNDQITIKTNLKVIRKGLIYNIND